MNRDMTKPTKWVCAQRRLRSAWASTQSDQSTQISLCIRPVWSESSLSQISLGIRPVWSEYSDQPGHPPSLIRVFAVRMKKAWVLCYPLSAQRRLWSDWVCAQADLSLRWAYSYFVGFVMSSLKRLASMYGKSLVFLRNYDSDQPGHPSTHQSSLCVLLVVKGSNFLQSDQTGRIRRLTQVFAARTGHYIGFVVLLAQVIILVLLCSGSFNSFLYFSKYHPFLCEFVVYAVH